METAQNLSDTLVIKIEKSLDFRNAQAFRERCLEQARAGKLHFVFDFSETGILDSTGLGAIFTVYRQIALSSGSIRFAAASRPVEVVVKLTRTNRVFPQHASVEEALLAVQAAKNQAAQNAAPRIEAVPKESFVKRPAFQHASLYAPEAAANR